MMRLRLCEGRCRGMDVGMGVRVQEGRGEGRELGHGARRCDAGVGGCSTKDEPTRCLLLLVDTGESGHAARGQWAS